MVSNSFVKKVLEECKNKQNIFIFISKEDEVDTKRIIDSLLKLGKKVIVPVCNFSERSIITSELQSLKGVRPSTLGILEPVRIIEFPKKDIDIFFVPGTKFDKQGNRKGRGLGFFDRFLKEIKGKKPIIGLCFENQIEDKLNVKPWDIPVDKVIVEKV